MLCIDTLFSRSPSPYSSYYFPSFLFSHASALSKKPAVVLEATPVAATSLPKPQVLDWMRDLLKQAPPAFSIWTKHPGMAKHPFRDRLDRDSTLKSLLGNVEQSLEILSNQGPRTPLNALVAAPGAGKTFFLGMFRGFYNHAYSAYKSHFSCEQHIFVPLRSYHIFDLFPNAPALLSVYMTHELRIISIICLFVFTDTVGSLDATEISRLYDEKFLAGTGNYKRSYYINFDVGPCPCSPSSPSDFVNFTCFDFCMLPFAVFSSQIRMASTTSPQLLRCVPNINCGAPFSNLLSL